MRIEGAAARPAPQIKDAATEPSVNLAALVLDNPGAGYCSVRRSSCAPVSNGFTIIGYSRPVGGSWCFGSFLMRCVLTGVWGHSPAECVSHEKVRVPCRASCRASSFVRRRCRSSFQERASYCSRRRSFVDGLSRRSKRWRHMGRRRRHQHVHLARIANHNRRKHGFSRSQLP